MHRATGLFFVVCGRSGDERRGCRRAQRRNAGQAPVRDVPCRVDGSMGRDDAIARIFDHRP